MKNNKHNFKKAFTLMEILIASAILAMALVIATGVISQTSAYQGKLAAMRSTSNESRKLADMITADVRSANSDAKITLDDNPDHAMDFKNGIAMLNCDSFNSSDNFVSHFMFNLAAGGYLQSTYNTVSSNDAHILVLATTNKYKVYLSSSISSPNGIFYKEFSRLQTDGSIYTLKASDIGSVRGFPINESNRISSSDLKVNLAFAGFAPSVLSSNKLQPYVDFMVFVQTNNYDTTSVNSRYETEIRSMATSRSYNQ